MGYGRCEDVEVELHESLEAPHWSLQVAIGQFEFGCDVASPEVMHDWARFFADTFRTGRFLDIKLESGAYRHMEPKQLELGRAGDIAVLIRKCGEYDDRYFLVVRVPAGRVIYTPTLTQVEALIDAVNQVVADLAERSDASE
jgi:hypothetical protein